ncbi:uncharacterized protein LOC134319106 [Trichomycterus rosablanca]|uniref:uncharacterized protein LOC134319106 n=1 Tax=Trichomycterus rosablanca TaxID=2290929 RepID=UPI002F35D259
MHRQDKTKTSGHNYFGEEKGSEEAEKQVHQGFKGNIIYWKIMKSQVKFLFMNSKERFYTLVKKHSKDCWFHYVKQHKHHDVFHLCWCNTLVRLQHIKTNLQLSELSSFFFAKRHKKDKHHRSRRSQHTDPSDPLGSEHPKVRAISNRRNEQEYHSNVSKETIISVDDPLEVLLSHTPLSPTIEKHRINRKVWFGF